jgi:hypothetical protein
MENDVCSAVPSTAESGHNPGQEMDDMFDEKLMHMFLKDWEGSIPSWEAKVCESILLARSS